MVAKAGPANCISNARCGPSAVKSTPSATLPGREPTAAMRICPRGPTVGPRCPRPMSDRHDCDCSPPGESRPSPDIDGAAARRNQPGRRHPFEFRRRFPMPASPPVGESHKPCPAEPAAAARTMLDVFASVGAARFDVTWTNSAGKPRGPCSLRKKLQTLGDGMPEPENRDWLELRPHCRPWPRRLSPHAPRDA